MDYEAVVEACESAETSIEAILSDVAANFHRLHAVQEQISDAVVGAKLEQSYVLWEALHKERELAVVQQRNRELVAEGVECRCVSRSVCEGCERGWREEVGLGFIGSR